MSQPIKPGAGVTEQTREARPPRRDWVLLPLTGLITISLLVLAYALTARRMFPQVTPPGYASIYDCIRGTASPDHMHGNENAVCRGNGRDEPVVEYLLNSQGFRAGMELQPKQPGTYRIVMVGTSVAVGEGVAMDQAIATLLPRELSRATGRRIELYNESMIDQIPDSIAWHFSAILAAKPDMILWIVMPFDVNHKLDSEQSQDTVGQTAKADPNPAGRSSLLGRTLRRIKKDLAMGSIPQVVIDLSQHAMADYVSPSALFMLQHFLYASQSQYIQSYIMNTEQSGYLRAPMDPEWQDDLNRFDGDDARIEAQAREAGVPLVTVLIPDRAQASLVSMGKWPTGCNPYTFDNAVHSIVVSHGGTYVDVVPGFRTIPNPERYYFQVSDHPNAEGDNILSGLLAKGLTDGAIPALKAAAQPQLAEGPKL